MGTWAKLVVLAVIVGVITGALGVLLVGLTVHTEGVGFALANILLPGVYGVGLFVSNEIDKYAFWSLVATVQFAYALVLVLAVRFLLRRRTS
jgi:hypothetical protein